MKTGAKKLNIPEWLVDVRHRQVHRKTPPSLKSLLQGCEAALEWLKAEYWAKYKETGLKWQEGGGQWRWTLGVQGLLLTELTGVFCDLSFGGLVCE